MNQKKIALELEYFIFDLEKHGHYIDDFLIKASRAHEQEPKSSEWFKWKFFNNPFGKTILACAATKTEIVGCVGYGHQPFNQRGASFKGVLAFENFVDPAFQGHGIFSKLIKYVEQKVAEKDIDIMMVFPNRNSLRGYIKKNWSPLNIDAYYLKPLPSIRLLRALKDIKKPFLPLESNFSEIQNTCPKSLEYYSKNSLETPITLDYLKYRFFSYPNGHYKIYNEGTDLGIARLGKRGRLLEMQILFVNFKQLNTKRFKAMEKVLCANLKIDLISYPTSKNSALTTLLKKRFFFKVPSATNICYKILNPNLDLDMEQLELAAINYHTY